MNDSLKGLEMKEDFSPPSNPARTDSSTALTPAYSPASYWEAQQARPCHVEVDCDWPIPENPNFVTSTALWAVADLSAKEMRARRTSSLALGSAVSTINGSNHHLAISRAEHEAQWWFVRRVAVCLACGCSQRLDDIAAWC